MARTSRDECRWRFRYGGVATAALLAVAGFSPAAHAQDTDTDRLSRLVKLLVQNKILTQQQAASLVEQADRTPAAPRHVPARAPAPAAPAPAVPAAAAPPAAAPGTVRVTYVPESVRQDIAAQVEQQVIQRMKDEGTSPAVAAADWTQRIRIGGDVRLRGERDLLSPDNSPDFPNFNAINGTSNGWDSSGNSGLPPLLNSTESRTRFRLRARLDVAATIADWIDADIRVATGNDNSPVSTNQTLGTPGDFSKYQIWLDRAYVRMHPTGWLAVNAGRAPNPFWTTDLLFGESVNFDGLAVQGTYQAASQLGVFLTAGAFPVFNTDFNFGSTNLTKTASRDAYLFAGQAGADWQVRPDYDLKLALGYFDFERVAGSLSSPCYNPVAYGSCSTDDTKPGFVSFGNTMFPLRNLLVNSSNSTAAQPQYYGLASGFDVLNVHGELSFTKYNPIDVIFSGDFVKNLAFDARKILALNPSNNVSSDSKKFLGGDTGYAFGIQVGHRKLDERWDWNVAVTYKYLQTDAVLDSLTDPDFHLGGTNAKGYILGANLALARDAWLSATWRSANQVSGPTYSADSAMIDLNVRF